jgi:hypothetical protein
MATNILLYWDRFLWMIKAGSLSAEYKVALQELGVTSVILRGGLSKDDKSTTEYADT